MTDWEPLLKPTLRSVGAYEPGRSLDELMARHGLTEVAKLNWNEGLWGPLPGVEQAVTAALDQVWAYPEHAFNALREAIAAATGGAARADPAGARHPGADPHARGRVRGPGRYGRRARAHVRPLRPGVARGGRDGRARPVARPADRPRARRRGRRARSGARLAWICDPNNPTGARSNRASGGVPRRASVPTASWSPTRPTSTTSRRPTAIRREDDVADGRPVVIMRTFSKIFGLAGLRLGYAVADPALAALPAQRPGAVQRQPRGAGGRRGEPGPPGRARGAARGASPPRASASPPGSRRDGISRCPRQANFVLVELGADDLELPSGSCAAAC